MLNDFRRERINRLMLRRAPYRTAARLLFNAALLVAATLVLIFGRRHPAACIAAAVILGLLQTSFFEAMHWSVHQSLFESKALNTAVGCVCGFISIWPFFHYSAFHLDHHRFAADSERDPELLYGNLTELPDAAGRIMHVIKNGLMDPIRFARLLLLLGCSRSPRHAMHWNPDSPLLASAIIEARVMLILYGGLAVCAAMAAPSLFLYLGIALWVHSASMSLFALPEHAGLQRFADLEISSIPVAFRQVKFTRCFLSDPFTRYLRWNENYHATHHAFPSAPYYALGKISAELLPDLPHVHEGYLRFHLFGE